MLLVGPPGVAKTKSANLAAKALGLPFKRIQFTSDMLPSDILGAEVYDPKAREFTLKKGPIFSSFVLADEINRAPPKVQSALLECMQEQQVTIANASLPLDDLFFVVATMNPYDGVGTYTLPDAMLDRFLISYELGYPSLATEAKILANAVSHDEVTPICTHANIVKWKKICLEETFIDPKIFHYIVRLIDAFRQQVGTKFTHGISTRSALALTAAAKVLARIRGRNFVIPEDIKYLLPMVLAHRIRLSFGAVSQGETVSKCIQEVLGSVPVEYDQAS
jgi:MoxR-like ATPase